MTYGQSSVREIMRARALASLTSLFTASSILIGSNLRANALELPEVELSKEQVIGLQSELAERGYPVNITGFIDQPTRVSIVQYQTDFNLLITGKITIKTLQSLGINLLTTAKNPER